MMLHFEVSILPLVVIALVNFFLSWIWYSPVLFLKPWATALGTYGKTEMTEAEKKAMPFLFLNGLIASFILSYGLQVVVHSVGAVDFFGGLVVGVAVWATFALTHSLSTLWEGRKPIVLVINNGLYLLTYAVFGGVVAVWR
jgi:Protein of unknown function (DUF1761)